MPSGRAGAHPLAVGGLATAAFTCSLYPAEARFLGTGEYSPGLSVPDLPPWGAALTLPSGGSSVARASAATCRRHHPRNNPPVRCAPGRTCKRPYPLRATCGGVLSTSALRPRRQRLARCPQDCGPWGDLAGTIRIRRIHGRASRLALTRHGRSAGRALTLAAIGIAAGVVRVAAIAVVIMPLAFTVACALLPAPQARPTAMADGGGPCHAAGRV